MNQDKRQELITERMFQLKGFRYFIDETEIGKWEIAHSNLDIEEVIKNKTSIKSVRIVKKRLSL